MIFFMIKDRKVNYVFKINIDLVIYFGGGYFLFLYLVFIIIIILIYYKYC